MPFSPCIRTSAVWITSRSPRQNSCFIFCWSMWLNCPSWHILPITLPFPHTSVSEGLFLHILNKPCAINILVLANTKGRKFWCAIVVDFFCFLVVSFLFSKLEFFIWFHSTFIYLAKYSVSFPVINILCRQYFNIFVILEWFYIYRKYCKGKTSVFIYLILSV